MVGRLADRPRIGNKVLAAREALGYLRRRRRGRRCCIQHPGRVDSSHPDPARHASGGLTQTPRRDGGGKGDERKRSWREREQEEERLCEGRGWGGTKGKGGNQEREGLRKGGRRERSEEQKKERERPRGGRGAIQAVTLAFSSAGTCRCGRSGCRLSARCPLSQFPSLHIQDTDTSRPETVSLFT